MMIILSSGSVRLLATILMTVVVVNTANSIGQGMFSEISADMSVDFSKVSGCLGKSYGYQISVNDFEVSRCQPVDYFIGCYADVLDAVDARCSGRRSCSINIPDPELVKQQPCRKDLVVYFEAAYKCVAVSGPTHEASCDGSVVYLTSSSGYLSSRSFSSSFSDNPIPTTSSPSSISTKPTSTTAATLSHSLQTSAISSFVTGPKSPPSVTIASSTVSSTTVTGRTTGRTISLPVSISAPSASSDRCNWLLNVPAGQRINITLYDFTGGVRVSYDARQYPLQQQQQQRHQASAPVIGETSCPLVAVFSETGRPDFRLRSCRVRLGKSTIYTSHSNQLQVSIIKQPWTSITNDVTEPNFLFHYQAIGCADLVTPAYAQLTRRGDTTTISCNYTTERWHLVCKTNEWIGAHINCSSVPPSGAAENLELPHANIQHMPLGLLVAVILGAAVGIITGCLFLVIVFVLRKKFRFPTALQKVEGGSRRVLSSSRDYDSTNIYKLIDASTLCPVHLDDATTTNCTMTSFFDDTSSADAITATSNFSGPFICSCAAGDNITEANSHDDMARRRGLYPQDDGTENDDDDAVVQRFRKPAYIQCGVVGVNRGGHGDCFTRTILCGGSERHCGTMNCLQPGYHHCPSQPTQYVNERLLTLAGSTQYHDFSHADLSTSDVISFSKSYACDVSLASQCCAQADLLQSTTSRPAAMDDGISSSAATTHCDIVTRDV